MVSLGEWTADCGGDWCLSGRRWFANYWPDNTVSASIYAGEEGDETPLETSGIMSGESRADCQRKAEVWIRAHLDDATPPVSAAPEVPRYTDDDPNEEPFVYEDDDAGSPVVPAATDEAWAGMNLSDDERAGLLSALDDLHGPTATDEPALTVIHEAINEACNDPLTTGDFYVDPQGFAAALRSAGYVMLPRDLLDRLREMMDTAGTSSLLYKAAAAVVEAVGPTREDTKA